jgi:hypothetical protein
MRLLGKQVTGPPSGARAHRQRHSDHRLPSKSRPCEPGVEPGVPPPKVTSGSGSVRGDVSRFRRVSSLGRIPGRYARPCGDCLDSYSPSQRWRLADVGGGQNQIRDEAIGWCLDVGGSAHPVNVDLHLAPGNSASASQHWLLSPAAAPNRRGAQQPGGYAGGVPHGGLENAATKQLLDHNIRPPSRGPPPCPTALRNRRIRRSKCCGQFPWSRAATRLGEWLRAGMHPGIPAQ